jgi:hypothetical protein
MPVRDVVIAELVPEPIAQSQPHLDPQRVRYYQEHLDDSTPVVVYEIDGRLLLADGYHRVAAARRLGRERIRADVRRGDRSDALRFAVELAAHQRGLTEQQAMEAIARRYRTPE